MDLQNLEEGARQALPGDAPASANDVQHGGGHYRELKYQHWDFAVETNQPYLIGCATKYVSRWRRKGGVEDLKKAKHYLQKAKETDVSQGTHHGSFVDRFNAQLEPADAHIIELIMDDKRRKAIEAIDALIVDHGDTSFSVPAQDAPTPIDLDAPASS